MKQIDWACDENVLIAFDREPVVQVRVIKPTMNKLERQSVIRYPFVNKKPLKVLIYDHKKFKQYDFLIRENYCFDGATISRFFWRIIGPNTDNQFLVAALCHDVLCENPQYIDYNRQLSTDVFNALLKVSGVNPLKRFLMKHSVNIFQSMQKKWKNNC